MKNPLNIIQFVEKKTGKSLELESLKEKVRFYKSSTLTLEECQIEMNRSNGNLYLRDCTSLKSLPDGLQVIGDLNLENCASLTSLPDGLEVDGFLDLFGCESLTSLPDGLQVTGNLDLRQCKSLSKIGRGIKVGGLLVVSLSVPQLYDLPDEKLVSMFGLENERRIRSR